MTIDGGYIGLATNKTYALIYKDSGTSFNLFQNITLSEPYKRTIDLDDQMKYLILPDMDENYNVLVKTYKMNEN